MLGDAPKDREADGDGVLVGVGGTEPVEDGDGGTDPVGDRVGGIDPVGELLGVLERVLAAVTLGVGELLGGRVPYRASM